MTDVFKQWDKNCHFHHEQSCCGQWHIEVHIRFGWRIWYPWKFVHEPIGDRSGPSRKPETFLLNRSGKAKFFSGVQMIWRLVNKVMITWYWKNWWDNLLFRAHRYNSDFWPQNVLIGCGEPKIKVWRAEMIPQSSRCKVDIFCSSLMNTRELK